MAGESRLTYGVGYSFDGAPLRDRQGYFNGDFEWSAYFSMAHLRLIEPFHGVDSDRFAILAKSTVTSGDPQDGDFPLGIQPTDLKPTAEELSAFEALLSGLRADFPALFDQEPTFGFVLSVTADI